MDKDEKARQEATERRKKYNKPWDVVDEPVKIEFPEVGQTPYSDRDKW